MRRNHGSACRENANRDARVMHGLAAVLAAGALLFLAMATVPVIAHGATKAELREQLARERAAWHKERVRLVQVARSKPSVQEAISLASFIYGVPRSTLHRIALCESTLNPNADTNRPYVGLFQFHPRTWRGNWYGKHGFDVRSPYANALGAAQHMSKYGFDAWECK